MIDDYEGAAEIERAWREGLTPDPLLTVSEWADRHRVLSSKASAEPGRWRTSRTPYLKAIMDCLSPTSPIERVVFMKAAQLGATEMGSNWIGYVIHHAPGPMMAVWPTVEMAKRNSKQRIDPLIEESSALAERIAPARSRDSGNTILAKEFRGGVLVMTGANSAVGLQLQLLEPEHLPATLNQELASGNVIRAGIEFDKLGRRVAYHLYRSHPGDGSLAPMSGTGGLDTVRVPANEIIHLFRPLRPGQIRGEPWLARALVKLNELDQYDDAELVRKKTAAMFAGFITRLSPEDNLMGEGLPDANGAAMAGLEPGTLQILEPGEDVKFSQPADVGASYAEFLRMQFRAVAAAMGITYEMLTGDLTQVNYSSIRAGLLEFRRRCEAIQHGVIVHQLCRPIWRAWMEQAVLEGALALPQFTEKKRDYFAAKWIPQGWQWVDPKKEFDAMLTAIRAGLLSRSEAISAFGYAPRTSTARSPPTTSAPMRSVWSSTPTRATTKRPNHRHQALP
jgi:lambda family phage portal protein